MKLTKKNELKTQQKGLTPKLISQRERVNELQDRAAENIKTEAWRKKNNSKNKKESLKCKRKQVKSSNIQRIGIPEYEKEERIEQKIMFDRQYSKITQNIGMT